MVLKLKIRNVLLPDIVFRLVALMLLANVVSCATTGAINDSTVQPELSGAIRYIDAGEARQLQLHSQALFVFVGDITEFDRHHIQGSILHSVSELGSLQLPAIADPVIIYSADLGTLFSNQAQSSLQKLADKIVVLRDGLPAWERDGYPLEGRDNPSQRKACTPVSAPALRRALLNLVDVALVDIRQKQDYETAHLPGAISAMPHELDKLAKSLHKKRWVLLYDETGGGAAFVGEHFIQQGFEYCAYLTGGYNAWLSGKVANATNAVNTH